MDPRISSAVPVSKALQELIAEERAMVIESEADFQQYIETSPFVLYQRFRTLPEIKTSTKREEEKEAVAEGKILEPKEVDDAASRFEHKNEELKAKTLLILRASITDEDSPEEVLNKVLRIYTDHALADEALDFLIETTRGRVQEVVKMAKEQLNQNFEREVKAGRNIGEAARSFSKEGLGSPTSLRDLYREITRNPREPLKLFEELTDLYPYDKLHFAILFLLHSLGSDLKSKGPSIPRGELKRLLDETRSLQGILGIFRFFQSRARLIENQFASSNLLFPARLNFEALAKVFVKILAERYINAEKALQYAKLLGLSEETAAQIIIYTQYRDAVRQIAPRYYRNSQHKDELLKALIEALEDLEDELDEEK
ncbi:MAG: hypothetical protein KGJ02_02655 [Verrucomicrobiota bacterium]|nr:hypothetical protein [Verrucomicrobiota bacterium]